MSKRYLVTEAFLSWAWPGNRLPFGVTKSHPLHPKEVPADAVLLTREQVRDAIDYHTCAVSPDVIEGILDELFGKTEVGE